ncbi:hypothetical protein M970_010040 [Encephalitozoon cuniculi EcunIII-L]|nr:hypothetical protein M970_010040 [Encephalitozoon cuniculi EcunIII-L]
MEEKILKTQKNEFSIIINSIYVVSMVVFTVLWSFGIEKKGRVLVIAVEALAQLSFTMSVAAYWIVRIWKKNLGKSEGKSRLLYWGVLFFCSVYLFLLIPMFIFLTTTEKGGKGFGKFLGEESPSVALVYVIFNSLQLLPRSSFVSCEVEALVHVTIQVVLVVSMIVAYVQDREDIMPYTCMVCGIGLGGFLLLKELFLQHLRHNSEKYKSAYSRLQFVTAIIAISALYGFKVRFPGHHQLLSIP